MLQSTGLNRVLCERGSAGFLGSAQRAETPCCPGSCAAWALTAQWYFMASLYVWYKAG